MHGLRRKACTNANYIVYWWVMESRETRNAAEFTGFIHRKRIRVRIEFTFEEWRFYAQSEFHQREQQLERGAQSFVPWRSDTRSRTWIYELGKMSSSRQLLAGGIDILVPVSSNYTLLSSDGFRHSFDVTLGDPRGEESCFIYYSALLRAPLSVWNNASIGNWVCKHRGLWLRRINAIDIYNIRSNIPTQRCMA